MSPSAKRTLFRWTLRGGAALIVVGLLVYALWPQPVPVDMVQATRGSFEVAITDDGRTRVRDVYVVSAPVGGQVTRLESNAGDPVTAAQSVLARIRPSDPAMLDVRTRRELEAAVGAAEAALALAEAEVASAVAAAQFAESEFDRVQRLQDRGAVSLAQLDRARLELATAQAAVTSARASMSMRQHELDTARAALIDPTRPDATAQAGACCVEVLAPIDGTILRTLQESETVVAAGTPLVEIGDPQDLEVVVDLLSTDAVQVAPGMPARISNWGGPGALAGVVDRVEPYAVTRVSSLGIEEQRVDVIVSLTDPRERWERLGHGFRVDVSVLLRQAEDVLQVPLGAVFRQGDGWAVFRVVDGVAVETPVEVGALTAEGVEILDGLEVGQMIVQHPSDRVADGVSVVARDDG
jgi:HlyD family secretion protein